MNNTNNPPTFFGHKKLPISAGRTVPLSNSPTVIPKTSGQQGPTAPTAAEIRKNG